jgi:PAS domain S-box-containing protein
MSRITSALRALFKKLRFPSGSSHPLLIASLAVALAAAVRFALDPLVQYQGPYLFFAMAVVLAAVYGGAWAGIGATVLSIPVCDYLFIEPRYTWNHAHGDSVMLALFACLGVLTAVVIDRLHKTRRRFEDALVNVQHKESKLEMITAAVPEILFTANRDASVEYLNEHLSQYSGRKSQELLGRGWLHVVHPDDRGHMEAAFAKCLQSGSEHEGAIRLCRFDGVYRWFKCHARPMRASDGRAVKLFGVCADIDYEKNLAAALENRTQELLQLNESLERFAYTASHDLQQPLRTIGTMTAALLSHSRDKLDSESSELLDAVIKSSERMARLIRDIMDFSKAGSLVDGAWKDVYTDAVAQNAIANLGRAIQESGARVVLGELPVIPANECAMLRMLQNLIENAIKYRGEKRPEVRIWASLQGKEWVFAVRDNGIGIDRRHHDRIFEPFHRLHPQSKYEGSGLGLSACKRIVEAHNGRIWVESQPGEGSTFFFTIPVQAWQEGGTARKPPVLESGAVNAMAGGGLS